MLLPRLSLFLLLTPKIKRIQVTARAVSKNSDYVASLPDAISDDPTQTPPQLHTRTGYECGCLWVSSVSGTGMSTLGLDILEAVLGRS